MLNHTSRSGAFPGLEATTKFKNQTWVIIPVGTKAAYVAAQALPKALVSCMVEAPTAGGDDGAKAVGGDSTDDSPCGGASLAGEERGTAATDALEERGPTADTQSESLDHPAAAPEDPAARLFLDKRRQGILWCRNRVLVLGVSSDAPMPTAAASPPKGSAFITPTASPSAGSEAPLPAGPAITAFAAAPLAWKARTTRATGTSQPDALPLQLFVPNGVKGVGVKRSGGDLEEAEGCEEGASGAEARTKSKIESLAAEVASLEKEGTLLVSPPPPTLNPFCTTKQSP